MDWAASRRPPRNQRGDAACNGRSFRGGRRWITTCSPKYLFWPGRQPHRPAISLVGRSPPLSRPMRGRILIKLCGREGLSLTLWQTPFNLSLLAIATLLLHQRSSFSQGISTKQNNGQKQENAVQFCSCVDGETWTSPGAKRKPCGYELNLEECTCLDEETYSSYDDLKENCKKRDNPIQSCTCEDGEIYDKSDIKDSCDRDENPIESCTCVDETTWTKPEEGCTPEEFKQGRGRGKGRGRGRGKGKGKGKDKSKNCCNDDAAMVKGKGNENEGQHRAHIGKLCRADLSDILLATCVIQGAGHCSHLACFALWC